MSAPIAGLCCIAAVPYHQTLGSGMNLTLVRKIAAVDVATLLAGEIEDSPIRAFACPSLTKLAVEINRDGVAAANQNTNAFLWLRHIPAGQERRKCSCASWFGDDPQNFP